MSPTDPGRMVCPRCVGDVADRHFDEDLDSWVFACPDCEDVDGAYTWLVADESGRVGSGRDLRDGRGIMADLGIYDGVLEAIGPGTPFLEFGVVEYRYAYTDREAYRVLLERYGHVAITGGARNTASWMLGRALWAVYRNGELVRTTVPATGRWQYLHKVSAWALPPGPEDGGVMSWEAFATSEGIDPKDWPPLELL